MVAKNPHPTVDIEAIFRDGTLIDEAMRLAARDSLLDHKRTGDPIVVWQDGKVVWIPADQIEVDEPAAPDRAPDDSQD